MEHAWVIHLIPSANNGYNQLLWLRFEGYLRFSAFCFFFFRS